MADEALSLDPARCVLIVMDLQNDVIIEGGAFADTGSAEHAKEQNIVENVQYCRRGAYWCPGRISGCCPVGWACGSTTCYRSANRSSPAARSNKIPGR